MSGVSTGRFRSIDRWDGVCVHSHKQIDRPHLVCVADYGDHNINSMTSFGSDRVPLLAAAGPAGRRFGGRLLSLAAAFVLSLALVVVVLLPLNMKPTHPNVMWRARAGSSRDRLAFQGEWLGGGGGGIDYTSSKSTCSPACLAACSLA